jgi:alanine racemase
VRGDWVRPGIAAYGSAPDFPQHDAVHWGLRPAMTLRSR